MRNQKRVAGLVWCLAVGLFTAGMAQQAFHLPKFEVEQKLKSEWMLKVGPTIPLNDFSAALGESGVPQGASTGLSADISYRYYRTPFFAVGAVMGAQLLGYNFASAITEPYPGKLHTVGWEVYSAGILFQTRVPIIPKLYLLGQVQARMAYMRSPMAWAVESTPILDDKGKRIGTDRKRTDLILPQNNYDAVLCGEIGMQYRIKRNFLAQLTVEYRRAVVYNFYSKTRVPVETAPDLQYRYSTITMNVGFTYAFGAEKDEKDKYRHTKHAR